MEEATGETAIQCFLEILVTHPQKHRALRGLPPPHSHPIRSRLTQTFFIFGVLGKSPPKNIAEGNAQDDAEGDELNVEDVD